MYRGANAKVGCVARRRSRCPGDQWKAAGSSVGSSITGGLAAFFRPIHGGFRRIAGGESDSGRASCAAVIFSMVALVASSSPGDAAATFSGWVSTKACSSTAAASVPERTSSASPTPGWCSSADRMAL
ncbi:Uncharacterised protein [Mycobacteroides abscessus subsp. massiliense]|nr:Uncharacterised protein [Mycobacteroides abscessus subsp. massiliense]